MRNLLNLFMPSRRYQVRFGHLYLQRTMGSIIPALSMKKVWLTKDSDWHLRPPKTSAYERIYARYVLWKHRDAQQNEEVRGSNEQTK